MMLDKDSAFEIFCSYDFFFSICLLDLFCSSFTRWSSSCAVLSTKPLGWI